MRIRYQARKLLLLNGILLGVIFLFRYAADMPIPLILLWAIISFLWVGRFLSNSRRR